MNQAEDRTEDFGVGQRAGRGNTVEDGWFDEVAVFVAGDFCVPAVDDRLRAIAYAGGNEGFDPLLAFLRNNGAHLHALVEPEANIDGGSGVSDGLAEGFLRLTYGHSNGNRKTALTRATERRISDDLAGEIHVGGRQDDDVVLGAAL